MTGHPASAFLGVGASGWSAIAASTTAAISLVVLVYAIKQVGEARRLREEQARPFVVADFEPDWLTDLVVQNVGKTAARNVTFSFDPPLSSTLSEPWPWVESTAFTSGVPLLPPHRELRLLFDALNARFDSALPMTYQVVVKYEGPHGSSTKYEDRYVLDLNVYRGMTAPPDGIPEISKQLREVTKVLKSWTHSLNGVRAYTIDAERHETARRAAVERQIAAQATPARRSRSATDAKSRTPTKRRGAR